jgi:hypothetical protein
MIMRITAGWCVTPCVVVHIYKLFENLCLNTRHHILEVCFVLSCTWHRQYALVAEYRNIDEHSILIWWSCVVSEGNIRKSDIPTVSFVYGSRLSIYTGFMYMAIHTDTWQLYVFSIRPIMQKQPRPFFISTNFAYDEIRCGIVSLAFFAIPSPGLM